MEHEIVGTLNVWVSINTPINLTVRKDCHGQHTSLQPSSETVDFDGETTMNQPTGGGGLQETPKVQKRIVPVLVTQRSENHKQVQERDTQRGSHSCNHGPQNGVVVEGGHVNLLNTSTCLGNVLEPWTRTRTLVNWSVKRPKRWQKKVGQNLFEKTTCSSLRNKKYGWYD
jgi:hypothetical protein